MIRAVKRLLFIFSCDVAIIKKLIIISVLVTLIPILVLGISLAAFSIRYSADLQMKETQREIESLTANIDFYLESILNKSDMILRDIEVQSLIDRPCASILDVLDTINAVDKRLAPLILNTRYEGGASKYAPRFYQNLKVTFYLNNPDFFAYQDHYERGVNFRDHREIADQPWYNELYTNYHWQYKMNGDSNRLSSIALIRKYYNYDNGDDLGEISIDMEPMFFAAIINGMFPEGSAGIMLIDPDGNVLASGNTLSGVNAPRIGELMNSGKNASLKINGAVYDANIRATSFANLRVIMLSDQSAQTAAARQIITICLAISSLSFLAASLMMFIMSRSLSKRLDLLKNKMKNMRYDDDSALEAIPGNDEIGQVGQQLNRMVTDIRNLIKLEYKSRIQIQLVESELLQEQMNPHLLYNSLSAIRWGLRNGGQNNLDAVINSLIAFYKMLLNNGRMYLSVKAETELLNAYLKLAAAIYRLRVTWDIHVDKSIENCECIKLILQPVVENSIVHAFTFKNPGGHIRVDVFPEGGLIVFRIRDNGEGIDPAVLDTILSTDDRRRKGFGIYNLNRRCKLIYGEPCGVTITSGGVGEGTCVEVRIQRREARL